MLKFLPLRSVKSIDAEARDCVGRKVPLNRPYSIRPTLCTLFICAVLFAGTVLLFSRALGYGFSNYDDPRYITNNSYVQAGFTWNSIVWAFTPQTDYWHPLSWLSHMLDWQIYGDNAAGHHLTSVLWHAANAMLAFLVLRRLTGSFWTSTFSAALFAWHPLRVESVVWITERKDLLCGFFFLLTLWAYTVYAQRRRLQLRARGNYLLSLGLFACGLMSKPMLVTLPVVLLILDFWPLRRCQLNSATTTTDTELSLTPILPSLWLKLLYEKIPFFALSAAASVVTVQTQQATGSLILKLPLDARIGNAAVSVVRYLGKFFWPFDLTPFYPHPGYWSWLAIIGSTLIVVGLAATAWFQRNIRPWVLTGWLLFLTMLLPTIGLIQAGFQSMADRYTYLPIFGVQLALLWTLREIAICRAFSWWITGVLAATLLMGCAARTWNQQATWKDPVTLLEHAIAVTERNDTAHALLGYTLFSLNQLDDATLHCNLALAINPHNEPATFTLAGVRAAQGRIDEAIGGYRTVLQLKPENADAGYLLSQLLLSQGHDDEAIGLAKSMATRQPTLLHLNLQNALEQTRLGHFQNALIHYKLAVALEPNDAAAQFGFGLVLARLGRSEEALAHYETAVKLQPDYAQAHTEIGLILLNRQQPEEALPHFRIAVKSQPDLGIAYIGLGRAAEKLGYADEAAASFEHAVAYAPNDPVAQAAWAETLVRHRQFDAAVPHYERAVQLQPRDAGAHAGLGYALFFSNQRQRAIAEWEEALRLDPNFPDLRKRLEQFRQ